MVPNSVYAPYACLRSNIINYTLYLIHYIYYTLYIIHGTLYGHYTLYFFYSVAF